MSRAPLNVSHRSRLAAASCMMPPMTNGSGVRRSGVPLVGWSCALLLGCAGTSERPTAVPTASVEAEVIVDNYRSDERLGDDLYNDKIVEITAFRVDEIGDGHVAMRDRGWILRLSGVAEERARVGETFVAVCEGDGLDGEKVIVFEGCSAR